MNVNVDNSRNDNRNINNNNANNNNNNNNNNAELYSDRTNINHWSDHQFYNTYITAVGNASGVTNLQYMSLDSFPNKFDVIVSCVNRNKIKLFDDNQFVVFSPKFSSNTKSKTYPKFCKYSLIHYKSWSGQVFNAFGGQNLTEDD